MTTAPGIASADPGSGFGSGYSGNGPTSSGVNVKSMMSSCVALELAFARLGVKVELEFSLFISTAEFLELEGTVDHCRVSIEKDISFVPGGVFASISATRPSIKSDSVEHIFEHMGHMSPKRWEPWELK